MCSSSNACNKYKSEYLISYNHNINKLQNYDDNIALLILNDSFSDYYLSLAIGMNRLIRQAKITSDINIHIKNFDEFCDKNNLDKDICKDIIIHSIYDEREFDINYNKDEIIFMKL